MTYLDSNNILTELQFGFRANMSPSDQLLLTYDYVSSSLDQCLAVDLIYLDYQKAFDKVHHRTLLDKLFSLGIRGNLHRWLEDFLTDRKMKVVVHGSSSHSVDVLSGVPQGSVLGPTLFLIFINHVVHDLHSKFCLFADDLKLYIASPYSSYSASSETLQSDLNIVYDRSISWGLPFSANKSSHLHFSRHHISRPCPTTFFLAGSPIPLVQSQRDLGITVDPSLKFHLHIRDKTQKANGIARSILDSTLSRDPEFMTLAFTSHIRPHLDYASVVWHSGYLGDIKLLESTQRRWTKQISGFHDLPYQERLSRSNLFSIRGRLLRADLIQVWKILNGHCPSLEHLLTRHTGTTRGHSLKLFLPRANTDLRSRSFSIRVVNDWNSLSEYVVSAPSLPSFKARLTQTNHSLLFSPLD